MGAGLLLTTVQTSVYLYFAPFRPIEAKLMHMVNGQNDYGTSMWYLKAILV